jgi:hypothetical protein
MGAEYEVLPYRTEIRWLSRGQVLKIRTKEELTLSERKRNPTLGQI